MKRHSGFTLLELLVVCGMIAMLAGLVIPTLGRARVIVRRGACGNNLHVLGSALASAAGEDSNKRYPFVATGQNAWNKIGHNKTAGNDPDGVQDGTRPLFQLIARTRKTAADVWVREKIDLVKADVFTCPSVRSMDTRVDLVEWTSGTNEQVGFESSKSIHYAYQHSINPNLTAGGAPVLTMIDDPRRIIMADRSPLATYPGAQTGYSGGQPDADSYDVLGSSTADADAGSPNHKGEGQNLLSLGGSVRFDSETVFDGDNIWQASDPDTGLPVATRETAAAGYDPISNVPEVFLVP